MHYTTVRSSKSLGPLRALQTLTTTERKKAKISNARMTFSLTKERGSFLILVQKSSFRRCWSVLLFHRSKKKKKKNFVERERDVAAEKRERFSFLVETSHHTKITHHHTSSQQEFFLLCDSTTLFCDTTFRFRDTATKETTSSVFVPSFRDAVYTC